MKRLVLTPRPGGELVIWQRPVEGGEYIVTCDPSLGRQWTDGGDESAIGVWRRWPGHIIEQCAELTCKWPIGRVGEALACISRWYGGSYIDPESGNEKSCAIVNIERNLMDAPKFAMTESQAFSEEFFFVPREHRNIRPGEPKVYFTVKDYKSQHYLIGTLENYMDRKAIIIRSEATINELKTLEKNRAGDVPTNGKDRSIMTILACVTDQELPPVPEKEEKKKEPEECPWGVDRELWAKKHAPKKVRTVESWSAKSGSLLT
jgi:hypothetical protein